MPTRTARIRSLVAAGSRLCSQMLSMIMLTVAEQMLIPTSVAMQLPFEMNFLAVGPRQTRNRGAVGALAACHQKVSMLGHTVTGSHSLRSIMLISQSNWKWTLDAPRLLICRHAVDPRGPKSSEWSPHSTLTHRTCKDLQVALIGPRRSVRCSFPGESHTHRGGRPPTAVASSRRGSDFTPGRLGTRHAALWSSCASPLAACMRRCS